MSKLVRYKHHGWDVVVDGTLKGKHREMCLCFRCRRFKPNQPSNCPVAQENFNWCVKYGMTAPVFECPWIAIGKPDLKGLEPRLSGVEEFEKVLSKTSSTLKLKKKPGPKPKKPEDNILR